MNKKRDYRSPTTGARPLRKTQGQQGVRSADGLVKVLGGMWRGSKIPVIEAPGLRPSASRSRDIMFNWLQPIIRTAHVLDLFAGSGALGIEALSRGAQRADFVEYDPKVLIQVKSTVERLRAGSPISATVDFHQDKAESFLKRTQQPTWDLIFMDPPFSQSQDLLRECGTLLNQRIANTQGSVAGKAERHRPITLAIESEASDDAADSIHSMQLTLTHFELKKQKKVGQSVISLWQQAYP